MGSLAPITQTPFAGSLYDPAPRRFFKEGVKKQEDNRTSVGRCSPPLISSDVALDGEIVVPPPPPSRRPFNTMLTHHSLPARTQTTTNAHTQAIPFIHFSYIGTTYDDDGITPVSAHLPTGSVEQRSGEEKRPSSSILF